MRHWLKIGMLVCCLGGCSPEVEREKHIFYLHGMIVETQGVHAVSSTFGPYEYTAILDSLGVTGAVVHSEVRTPETDFQVFCNRVSKSIDSLTRNGIPPTHITVIGASKGGMMAMQISQQNTQPVNYVLLGAGSVHSEQTYKGSLHGRILGIYEASDAIADRDYSFWIARSPEAERFDQLQLQTGLGHGFLYRPIAEWLIPAREWMDQTSDPVLDQPK